MVKGISRQVIVVHSPDPKLFEQAIFILKENADREGITDEMLLKEAKRVVRGFDGPNKGRLVCLFGAFWAGSGAAVMGLVWLISTML